MGNQVIRQITNARTSLPSPFKIFHNTQTSCSFGPAPPSAGILLATSLSLLKVKRSADWKGLMDIGWGAYSAYRI